MNIFALNICLMILLNLHDFARCTVRPDCCRGLFDQTEDNVNNRLRSGPSGIPESGSSVQPVASVRNRASVDRFRGVLRLPAWRRFGGVIHSQSSGTESLIQRGVNAATAPTKVNVAGGGTSGLLARDGSAPERCHLALCRPALLFEVMTRDAAGYRPGRAGQVGQGGRSDGAGRGRGQRDREGLDLSETDLDMQGEEHVSSEVDECRAAVKLAAVLVGCVRSQSGAPRRGSCDRQGHTCIRCAVMQPTPAG